MKNWHFSIHPAGVLCLLASLLFVPANRLLAVALAVMIHEGGHLVAMRLCSIRHLEVEWTPLGFVAQAAGFPMLPTGKRLAIAAAGIGASGAAALLCLPFARQVYFAYQLLECNASLLLVNSLPVLPLDGSRVLLALAGKLGWEQKVERLLLLLSYLCSAALCVLGLYSAFQGTFNPLLLALGPYLAYAAHESVHSGGVYTVRRFEQRPGMVPGRLYPARTYAVTGPAEAAQCLRAAGHCPENSCLIVHQVDAVTGAVVCTLTEHQVKKTIFGVDKK